MWERFHGDVADQRQYYADLARVLGARHDLVLTRELRRVVDELVATIDAG